MHKPVIASFWYGSDLSWIEELCIRSFLDHGHRFVLYVAEDLDGIPEGTEVREAAEIMWPPPFDITDNDRVKVAVFSDIFRIRMIQETGFIWVDPDAYCVRPFDFQTPYVFSAYGKDVPNGVMGLPGDSEVLNEVLRFIYSPNPIQPWRGHKLKKRLTALAGQGVTWTILNLPWGCSGPKVLGHFLRQSGEIKYAMPRHTFYPIDIDDLAKLHDPDVPAGEIERDGVYSVHIYGFQKEIIATKMSGLPQAGSYLDRLCDRHGINPQDKKVPVLDWMRHKNPPRLIGL